MLDCTGDDAEAAISLISTRGRPSAAAKATRHVAVVEPEARQPPGRSKPGSGLPEGSVSPAEPASRARSTGRPHAFQHPASVRQSIHDLVDLVRAAAGRAAEEAALEPIVTIVSRDDHARWLERFDAPARTDGPLRRTMLTPAPWDPE